MPLTFYPHPEDTQKGMVEERVEVLADAAERYRAVILDTSAKAEAMVKKISLPKDQQAAFHWDEIARVMREVRELPEGTKDDRKRKAALLGKLAEIYEVLRAAKMPKLEAVRLALISESNQLGGGQKGASDVA